MYIPSDRSSATHIQIQERWYSFQLDLSTSLVSLYDLKTKLLQYCIPLAFVETLKPSYYKVKPPIKETFESEIKPFETTEGDNHGMPYERLLSYCIPIPKIITIDELYRERRRFRVSLEEIQ